jgi:hypothetical protein
MASTYVNDLRLNEMATGDGSGTWGTTTNTNLELIAEAFSYGTEAITTNADTHTTTIADGATDPGRSLYLKYTGTLDSACTITIGPNTVSKVWIIENGTSGSQNIIISQGSGANITIPAGDTKVVYSDGAGAGAAFFDAFASLSVVDLKVQDDLTVTDDASIGGDATITGTLGVTGNITGTLATAAQPNITSVGTLTGFTSTGIDDNADATAITIDSSENVMVGKSSLGIGVDGTEIRAGGQLLVTADGDNPVDFNRKTSDGVIALFRKDGTTMGSIGTDSSRFKVKSNSLALYLENESNKTLIWGNVSSVPYFYPQSDNDTNIGYPTQRFKDIYLSGGVYLGGTGAANHLDDYEEGDWTPTLNSGTFSAVSAQYTKVGRVVTLTVDMTIGTGGGSTISNAPFTAGSTVATGIFTTEQNFNAGRTAPTIIIGGGTTTMYFRDIGDNVAYQGMALTAGAGIAFSFTYIAA